MPISVTCHCGKKLTAPDAAAGKKAKCPACGQQVLVAVSSTAVRSKPSSEQPLAPEHRSDIRAERKMMSAGIAWTSYTYPFGIDRRGLIVTPTEFIQVTGPSSLGCFLFLDLLLLPFCFPVSIVLLIYYIVELFPLKKKACWKAFEQHDLAALKTFTRWCKSYPLDSCDIRFDDSNLRITADKLKLCFKANDRTREEYRAFADHIRRVL